MGMYDNLICEYSLSDKEVQNEEFQTKDFECFFDTYIITKDRNLMIKELKKNKPRKVDFHGDIRFYTFTGDHKDNSFKWYEYIARFTNGKLQWIKRIKNK